MKVCLVSPEPDAWSGIGHSTRRLAELLATRHEVTVVYSGADGQDRVRGADGVREVVAAPSGEVARMSYSCEDHRRSAAVLAAIEGAYGRSGPDYLEFCDFRGHGLVPLQARRAGHALLRETLVGVRACGSSELLCLHDGSLDRSPMRLLADLEREQLRLADRLLWPGGDVLDLYRRYYADVPLPEPLLVRRPLEPVAPEASPRERAQGGPLRILYAGRLQRSKGVLDLAEACQGLPADEWELTIVGADTPTAPLGQSVRMTIEAMWGGDPRVELVGPLPHEELQRLWGEHDLLVVPSRFEVWSETGLEAMRAGLPVLVTPVGGLAELVEPGVTGWQADASGPDPVRRALTRLLEDRDEVERVRSSAAVAERLRRLTDPGAILSAYEGLLSPGASKPGPPASPPGASAAGPLVTAVVPYFRSAQYAEEAVGSLLAQTHRNLEVLVVNDGSFEPSDMLLDTLASDPRVTVVTQLNRGDARARTLGARLARGKYVTMLDADNLYEPEFVARAVELLEADPGLAYVTCWLSYVDTGGSPLPEAAGYAPLGNSVLSADLENWDGDMMAVLPRRLFAELGYSYEPAASLHADWEFYRQLRQDGMFGAVIPERLARYRVRPASLSRTYGDAAHSLSEVEAATRRQLRRTGWTAEAL